MGPKILVVDDEETICNLLSRLLEREGYKVVKTTRGQDALKLILDEKPELMILDLNLPDLPGEAIYESVRQTPQARNLPILIITGRTLPGLSAKCLNGGADAFLPKPFDAPELLAQIRALLRRSNVYSEADKVIEKGSVVIHPAQRRVLLKGVPVDHLSPKEFDVLRELVMRSPEIVGKQALAVKVWGMSLEHLHPRTLDVHIRRIRKKLGAAGSRSLKTVPAVGFQWLSNS
jgi:two-component system phosphate regulon response regulator PhoB